jgi:glycosyltransferase involved in cell wall biosynthesis
MALGVPVVSTDVNGLRELVVDGQTGLVVPERDPTALADALGRLLRDPALAERLAASGRRLIESRYSLKRSVADLRALFPLAA